MKESWRRFKASKPGHRFQDSYHRRQESGHGRFGVRRIVNITLGSLLVIGSAFLGWLPGLGILTFFLGLVLIASELAPVARLLDWSEVWLRKLTRPAKRVWDRSSPAGKAVIVAVIVVCLVALAYGVYSLLFARDPSLASSFARSSRGAPRCAADLVSPAPDRTPCATSGPVWHPHLRRSLPQ